MSRRPPSDDPTRAPPQGQRGAGPATGADRASAAQPEAQNDLLPFQKPRDRRARTTMRAMPCGAAGVIATRLTSRTRASADALRQSAYQQSGRRTGRTMTLWWSPSSPTAVDGCDRAGRETCRLPGLSGSRWSAGTARRDRFVIAPPSDDFVMRTPPPVATLIADRRGPTVGRAGSFDASSGRLLGLVARTRSALQTR